MFWKSLVLLVGCWISSGVVSAAEDAVVTVGAAAPSFTVKDDQGKDWSSADHFGKKIVVVYFYPADMTGGCTKQACAFRDDLSKLTDLGVEVVGVSGDSPENHRQFKQAHQLTFSLLADEDGAVAQKFGVPVTREEKTVNTEFNGVKYTLTRKATAKRWTFIVAKDGKVAYLDNNVDAAKDSQKIREAIQNLK